MKIQYCSDLHLEFPLNKKFMEANPLEPVGDILILAGDILPFGLHKKQTAFIDFIADKYIIANLLLIFPSLKEQKV